MPRLGFWEIGLILLIMLIVFGAGKLPQIGGALGKTIREFRKAKEDDSESTETKSMIRAGVSATSNKET